MTVKVTKPAVNLREELADLRKPTGIAGEAMLRAETPQEQFNLIGAGRRNLIINGAMQVAQRGTSTSTSSTTGFSTVDRWGHNTSIPAGVSAITYSQSTDAPSGFGSSFKAVPDQSATSALSGGDRLIIIQTIEAQDLQQLGFGSSDAKSFTLSFWIKSNLTGTVTLELESPDSSSSYYFYTDTITINSSGTWEYKTVTIQPNSNGNINNDNGTGLLVALWFAAGPTFTSGGNPYNGTWHSTTNGNRADPSNINIYSSNTNYVNITGVQLEVGKVATPFEHRSYGEELALCQRYFCKTYSDGTAIGTATSTGAIMSVAYGTISYASAGTWQFPVEMRAAPTVTLYSTANANTTGKVTADSTDGAGVASSISTNSAVIYRGNDSTGVSASVFIKAQATANAEL